MAAYGERGGLPEMPPMERARRWILPEMLGLPICLLQGRATEGLQAKRRRGRLT